MPSLHLNHQVRQLLGEQNGQNFKRLYKDFFFMKNDIEFLNIELTTLYSLRNL